MITALDVDSNELIKKLAEKLEDVKKPEFVGIVKTGPSRQRPPSQENFWQLKCASLLRQAYSQPFIGTNRLRKHYSSRKTRGVKPQGHAPAGGSTIRKALQGLEAAGYLEKTKKGRSLTAKGRKLIDQTAKEIGGNA